MNIGRIIAGNPIGAGFLAFFILGWAYYMVATILMRGSIFEGLRSHVGSKSNSGSWFFSKVEEMLGCLMCTATEAALWTLGISTFVLGLWCGIVEQIMSSVTGKPIELHWLVDAILMLMISFALSLAVAGEAWAIKTVVEHKERRFLELREEFRLRELELLARVSDAESGGANLDIEYDLTVERG